MVNGGICLSPWTWASSLTTSVSSSLDPFLSSNDGDDNDDDKDDNDDEGDDGKGNNVLKNI